MIALQVGERVRIIMTFDLNHPVDINVGEVTNASAKGRLWMSVKLPSLEGESLLKGSNGTS